MNFKALLLSALALTLMVAALAIPGASACACVEPLTEAELNTIKARADRGDFDAIGRVLNEYNYIRGDRQNTALWTRRAIKAGAPLALSARADDWLWQAQRTPSLHDKKTFARAALAVLERGYQNRHRIPAKDSFGLNPAVSFAQSLREARAVDTVLNDGLRSWLAKARRHDPIAAYHVANYYFWVELDQQKRTYWETRASELGDPTFAGETVNHDRSTEQNLRDIGKALRSPSILARSGDKWMQQRFVEDLVERRTRLRSPVRAERSR